MKNECIYTEETLPVYMKKSLIDNYSSLPLTYKLMVEKNCLKWIKEIQTTGKLTLGKFNTVEDLIPHDYPREIIENPEDFYLINIQKDVSELIFMITTTLENYNTLDYNIRKSVQSELRRIIDLQTFYSSDMKTFMRVSKDLIEDGRIYLYNELIRKNISDIIFNHILPFKVKAYSLSIRLENDCRPSDDLQYLVSHSSLSIILQWIRTILNYTGYINPREISTTITKFSVGIILFCNLLDLDPLKYQHVFTAWGRFSTTIEKELNRILKNGNDLIEILREISSGDSENIEEIELFKQSIRRLEYAEKDNIKDKNHVVLFFPNYNKLSYEDFDELIMLIRSLDKDLIMKYIKTSNITFQLSEQDLLFLRKEYSDNSVIGILNDHTNAITNNIMKYLFATSEFNKDSDDSDIFLLFKILPDKICGIEVNRSDCKKIITIERDPNFLYTLNAVLEYRKIHENITGDEGGDIDDDI